MIQRHCGRAWTIIRSPVLVPLGHAMDSRTNRNPAGHAAAVRMRRGSAQLRGPRIQSALR